MIFYCNPFLAGFYFDSKLDSNCGWGKQLVAFSKSTHKNVCTTTEKMRRMAKDKENDGNKINHYIIESSSVIYWSLSAVIFERFLWLFFIVITFRLNMFHIEIWQYNMWNRTHMAKYSFDCRKAHHTRVDVLFLLFFSFSTRIYV